VPYPKIAAMGCFGTDSTWRKPELQAAVLAEQPDLLLLQGDQSYLHYNIASGFLELVYSINNITRNVPTLVQMDDHDYGMPNIWGAGTKEEDSGSGFDKPACVINALQNMALSHLPDAATNETLENGIDIKFTSYVYGNVDFAVLEARKFKSYKGDSLLGSEQEEWLRNVWCKHNAGAVKVVLSQTPFASLATNATNFYVGKGRIDTVNVSIDSNGYPPEGRRRFMEIAQDCAPLILSGDQHLGIAVTYEDFGVSECASPAVVNDVLYVLFEVSDESRSP
jgi:alkaline phosphatase D